MQLHRPSTAQRDWPGPGSTRALCTLAGPLQLKGGASASSHKDATCAPAKPPETLCPPKGTVFFTMCFPEGLFCFLPNHLLQLAITV